MTKQTAIVVFGSLRVNAKVAKLGKNFSRWHFEIFFSYFSQKIECDVDRRQFARNVSLFSWKKK